MSNQVKGSLITLLAGSFWGLSGASGQYLMEQGVHVNLLSSLRLFIAGAVLVGVLLLREPNKIRLMLTDKQTIFNLLLFSFFGLALNQFAYLKAIQHTNSGTATVLQYMAPIILLILVCLRDHRRPVTYELIAIGLAITGTLIMATHGDLTSLTMTPTGLFWGIFSAFTYVAYMLLPMASIKKWGSMPVIGVSMFFGGLVFPLVTQAWQHPTYLSLKTIPAYLGIIGIGTILAYTLFLKGVSLIGPIKGSLLASIEPIAAVFFALLLLQESFHLIDLVGMGLIILAVLTISWQGQR